MLYALATMVVLLWLGRDELYWKEYVGVVAFLIISGAAIALLHFQSVLIVVALVIADIYLLLRVFGSDIEIH